MTKNVFVLAIGCPISRIDSAQVENFLHENGWNIIPNFRKADLIIFRTCALLEQKEEESLEIIRKIKAEKKNSANLIVWGCLPKINPRKLKLEYDGTSFGEREIDILNEIVKAKKPIHEINANFLVPSFKYARPSENLLKNCFLKIPSFLLDYLQNQFSIARPSPSIFHIKIASGCLGNCTFCAIRKARGVLRSKNINKILEEFRDGLSRGFKYFSLLATDLGAYGRDQGHTLVDLLYEMTKEIGDYQIALRNVNPCFLIEMFEKLKPFFSSGKIWFLSSSVESGSNRILKLMGRKYKIEDFEKCIRTLNKEYPNILLRTQIMVGFPTETEQDFKKSMQLLDRLEFDWIELYRYSKRPGTIAAIMKSQVSEKIKVTRYLKLLIKFLLHHPLRKITRMPV